ncbi:putative F-box protein At1g32420 [Andrographis paniculata]|uniref:putative F-box protein At1g32420 n=1 Tax=Andrographis paniculata TaxID=175694 RepID=UPI0021E6FB4E|nr:putative F-box protein At1g32420 [Andrographis paniculata]
MAEQLHRALVPSDLVELILMRLPVESLLRFKSVSKSWNDTISSREFALAHLHQSKNNPSSSSHRNMFLSQSLRNKNIYSLSRLMENNKWKRLPKYYFRLRNQSCCHGLMLAYSRSFSRVIIWNPSARKYTDLGFPFQNRRQVECGIGFDPLSDDYKIVAHEPFTEPYTLIPSTIRYTVFDNRNRRWNELKTTVMALMRGEMTEIDRYYIKINFFNIRDEKFYKIMYKTGRGSRTGSTSYCLVDCSSTHFCMLIGDACHDKCRVGWKKTGGEWTEFDDLSIPWMELWMKSTDTWDLRKVLRPENMCKMYLADYDDDRELIFIICHRYKTCFIIYNLTQKKCRVILKPKFMSSECLWMGHLDNLFFS